MIAFRFFRQIRRFALDKKGNFAILFALSSLVFIGLVGIGIDYWINISYRGRLDTAADAAALAAVKTAQSYVEANDSSQTVSSLTQAAMAAGKAEGLKTFAANAGPVLKFLPTTPTIALSYASLTFSASVSYSTPRSMIFGPLFGVKTATIANQSTATISLPTYINYYIIVDNGQSMGIAATPADEQNLFNLSASQNWIADHETGCVFGCHVNTQSSSPYSFEALAHDANPPITLRIDSARTAVQDIISAASLAAGTLGNIQIGIYEMHMDPTNYNALYKTVAPQTNNYTQLAQEANTIDLGNNTTQGYGDSNMDASLPAIASLIPENGNGLSANSPLNYVMVVTDGLEDIPFDQTPNDCENEPDNGNIYHCTSAISPSACSELQAKATVQVVYTTYLPIYANNNPSDGLEGNYNSLVKPYVSQIAPNLQACASNSSSYFEASDGPALISAMNTLFANTMGLARLTH